LDEELQQRAAGKVEKVRNSRQASGDVSQLKQRLIDSWSNLPQDVIDEAIDQWQVRLRACLKAKGGHFEHLLH